MKEEEARKKWCPMTTKEAESDLCIASDCMMWRWKMSLIESKPDYDVYDNRQEGYCGLVGKP